MFALGFARIWVVITRKYGGEYVNLAPKHQNGLRDSLLEHTVHSVLEKKPCHKNISLCLFSVYSFLFFLVFLALNT